MNMMTGVSTLTQKGQVAIPKVIRDYFGLKPSDKMRFEVKDNAIVAHRMYSIEELRGVAHIPGKKPLTKKQMKKIIQDAVLEKFRKKSLREKNFSP